MNINQNSGNSMYQNGGKLLSPPLVPNCLLLFGEGRVALQSEEDICIMKHMVLNGLHKSKLGGERGPEEVEREAAVFDQQHSILRNARIKVKWSFNGNRCLEMQVVLLESAGGEDKKDGLLLLRLEEKNIIEHLRRVSYVSLAPVHRGTHSYPNLWCLTNTFVASTVCLTEDSTGRVNAAIGRVNSGIFRLALKESQILLCLTYNYSTVCRLLVVPLSTDSRCLEGPVLDWVDICFDTASFQSFFTRSQPQKEPPPYSDHSYSATLDTGKQASLRHLLISIHKACSSPISSSEVSSLCCEYMCVHVYERTSHLVVSYVVQKDRSAHTLLYFEEHSLPKMEATADEKPVMGRSWKAKVSKRMMMSEFGVNLAEASQSDRYLFYINMCSSYLAFHTPKETFSPQRNQEASSEDYSEESNPLAEEFAASGRELFHKRGFFGNEYKTPFTLSLLTSNGVLPIGIKVYTYSALSCKTLGVFVAMNPILYNTMLGAKETALDWINRFDWDAILVTFEMETIGDCFTSEIEILKARLPTGGRFQILHIDSIINNYI